MKKLIILAFFKDILDKVLKEEITLSRAAELLNEEANKNLGYPDLIKIPKEVINTKIYSENGLYYLEDLRTSKQLRYFEGFFYLLSLDPKETLTEDDLKLEVHYLKSEDEREVKPSFQFGNGVIEYCGEFYKKIS